MIRNEITIGYGVKLALIRKGNLVVASIVRNAYKVEASLEYAKLTEKIPDGFKPNVQVHLIANKNVNAKHVDTSVWHFSADGSINITNQLGDTAVYTGTVTYLTEDN